MTLLNYEINQLVFKDRNKAIKRIKEITDRLKMCVKDYGWYNDDPSHAIIHTECFNEDTLILFLSRFLKINESTVRSCFVIDYDSNNESLYTKEYLRKALSDNIGKLVTKNLNNIL